MANRIPLFLDPATHRSSQMKTGDLIPLQYLPNGVVYNDRIHQSTGVTRSASTYAQIASFQLTPGTAGNFVFQANLQVNTGAVNGKITAAFAVNGTVVSTSSRSFSCSTSILGLITLSVNTIEGSLILSERITCTATDIVSVHYLSVGGQTVTVSERDLYWMKVV